MLIDLADAVRGEAARTLIDAVRQSAIMSGLDKEGAIRPDMLPPRPEEPRTGAAGKHRRRRFRDDEGIEL
jgi:hypothetical protein